MKKIIPLIMIILLLLPSCQLSNRTVPEATSQTASQTQEQLYSASASDISSQPSFSETLSLSAALTATTPESGTLPTAVSVLSPSKTTTKKPITISTNKVTTPAKPTAGTTATTKSTPVAASEMRGVWISCYDHISAAGKTRAEYKSATDNMFKTISDMGLNTAFVHLRAFSDAFYKSDIFPYSSYIAGSEGASLAFDPFAVMLESAAKYKISVHGWINPFRVSTKNNPNKLSSANPAKKILDSGNANGEICVLSNGIYYNPALASNQKLILDGVREIISKYKIDGIHIDDYFYPSTDKSIDEKQYLQYRADGGSLGLAEWRQTNVNAFVASLYSTVKAADSSLTVSISPAATIEKNKTELYADCELWLSKKGYADIIIPQIYFGFDHQTVDFASTLKKWSNLKRHSDVQLVCGLAAYKCGKKDDYAGTGSTEWQENSDILARQLSLTRKNTNYSGFVVFSYQDLTRSSCKTEINNFKNAVNSAAG